MESYYCFNGSKCVGGSKQITVRAFWATYCLIKNQKRTVRYLDQIQTSNSETTRAVWTCYGHSFYTFLRTQLKAQKFYNNIGPDAAGIGSNSFQLHQWSKAGSRCSTFRAQYWIMVSSNFASGATGFYLKSLSGIASWICLVTTVSIYSPAQTSHKDRAVSKRDVIILEITSIPLMSSDWLLMAISLQPSFILSRQMSYVGNLVPERFRLSPD